MPVPLAVLPVCVCNVNSEEVRLTIHLFAADDQEYDLLCLDESQVLTEDGARIRRALKMIETHKQTVSLRILLISMYGERASATSRYILDHLIMCPLTNFLCHFMLASIYTQIRTLILSRRRNFEDLRPLHHKTWNYLLSTYGICQTCRAVLLHD